jgi:hypothetical protein
MLFKECVIINVYLKFFPNLKNVYYCVIFTNYKAYGTESALKPFINEFHWQGIAVIMDMVLNHSFGSSPMVQMYFDGSNNVPSANNPWFNQYPTYAFNVGYQFNHENPAAKDFTQKVLAHWLTNYHIDGYRFDLAKGFTQKRTCDAKPATTQIGGFALSIADKPQGRKSEISSFKKIIIAARTDNASPVKLKVAVISKDAVSFASYVTVNNQLHDIEIPLSELKPGSSLLLPRPYPSFQPLGFTLSSSNNFDLKEADKLQISYVPNVSGNNIPFTLEIGSVFIQK